jgi:hypothetical protein
LSPSLLHLRSWCPQKMRSQVYWLLNCSNRLWYGKGLDWFVRNLGLKKQLSVLDLMWRNTFCIDDSSCIHIKQVECFFKLRDFIAWNTWALVVLGFESTGFGFGCDW